MHLSDLTEVTGKPDLKGLKEVRLVFYDRRQKNSPLAPFITSGGDFATSTVGGGDGFSDVSGDGGSSDGGGGDGGGCGGGCGS